MTLTYRDDGHRYIKEEWNPMGRGTPNAGKLRIRGYQADGVDGGRYRWVKTFVHRYGQSVQDVHAEAQRWADEGNGLRPTVDDESASQALTVDIPPTPTMYRD